MKIRSEIWTIGKLINQRPKINPKPQYQRTSVWSLAKKRLLMDSILRGYDIPKFYLTETPSDHHYRWEVTDGQQRMNAIWEFVDGSPTAYSLTELEISGLQLKNLAFSDLRDKKYKKIYEKFLNYELHFSVIRNATAEEVRSLFARLQMGERLSQVELRHAIPSNIGNLIFSMTENHDFFRECRIPNARYKHQDYLDHVVALVYYELKRNAKAADMRSLYLEQANVSLHVIQPLMKKVSKTLDLMGKINARKKGMFKNKWAFVDTFLLIYQNLHLIRDVHPEQFADAFAEFEAARRQYNKDPHLLLETHSHTMQANRDMYNYIVAFKTAGAEKHNIETRNKVFNRYFFNDQNFLLR